MTIICLHLNKRTETKESRRESYSQPAEYISREICQTCGEESCIDDELVADVEGFLKAVEIEELEYDKNDYPDMCDSFIIAGNIDGRELIEAELEFINDECREWVEQAARESMMGG